MSHADDEIESIEQELSQVERGLQTASSGRAAFNSIQSALGDVRSHLQRLSSMSPSVAGREHALSERLQTAELAHSERIPLNLLQGSVRERRQSTRDRLLSSFRRTSKNVEEKETEDQESSSRRRSSMLLASRHRASQAGGLQLDLDLHENAGLLLSPVSEEHASSKTTEHEHETSEEDMDLEEELEQPMLLSKRQEHFMTSSGSLSGSLRDVSSSDSLVYSWGGPGVQSLHDDNVDYDMIAKVSKESRIGRPGAPAVLSVATSRHHTACATARGQVYTCGVNVDGAVNPSLKDSSEPLSRPTLLESLSLTRILQVSCGLNHTAALSENGSVLTWGGNQEGQLGHRSPETQSFCSPKGMLLGGGKRAAAVACGHGFTLVLTTRMCLMACGIEEIAGYNNTESTERGPRSIPAMEGLPIVSVAAGSRHAVITTVHGSAFAWGLNKSGCCGRPYPEQITLPVPIHMPESTTPPTEKEPFANWAKWKNDDNAISLKDDVAVVHAACGDEHTVLVTRSGRLLCCGSNEHGQLALLGSNEEELAITNVQPVSHPMVDRKFVTAEAGDEHTLLLDDAGDVWQLGKELDAVIQGQNVVAIAAGGKSSIAVAATKRGALRRQFSVTLEPIVVDESLVAESMEALLETLEDEGDKDELSPSGKELASRTEELLSNPASLNSLFLDPAELDNLYEKLMSTGNAKFQQAVATAIETGIKNGLEKLRPDKARMIYPETVRCLLVYIKFFDRDMETSDIVFDRFGDCILALCETMLSLPFEGYKALLTWATSVCYPRELFVKMLVRPLLVQLDAALLIDVDENGVQHKHRSRRAIPVIVAVLRWLHSASERVDHATPQDFYSEGIGEVPIESLYEDLARFKKANKNQRATNFFLCASPFLLSPGTKRKLLQTESQVEMFKVMTQDMTFNEEEGAYTVDPFYVLEIERDHLLHQTLEQIKVAKPTDLRKKLRVSFKGEEGVDAGGVTKEFFQLLSEALFDINSGLWSSRFGSDITWFNSDCTWDEESYELTGVLVGLALYNGVLVDVHFPGAVYRKLLGLPLGLEDLVDEELKKGLQKLLEFEGEDVEYIFCLTFEVTWTNLGQEQTFELKPGGSDIAVTNDNREEYVMLYVKWLLVDSIQPQWDAFEKGLHRVMEGSSLSLFRPDELELLVVGTPELDFDALEANTEYEGGYDKDSPVVVNFWHFVKQAPRESQLQFLKFATGSSQAPIGGLAELHFKIQRAGADSPQLPTSHTCFNTLLLPDYGEDKEKLERLLGRAILECEGFGLE